MDNKQSLSNISTFTIVHDLKFVDNADYMSNVRHGSRKTRIRDRSDDDDDYSVESCVVSDSAEAEYYSLSDDADSVNAECSDDDCDGRGLK